MPQPPPDPLAAARAARPTPELARRAIASLDLTSLRGDEAPAEIEALCARARAAGVAAVCVPPASVTVARAALAGGRVRLATVANFPEGGDDVARAAEEVAAATAEGAQEVDIVAPLAAMAEGDLGLVGDMVQAARAAAAPGTLLKLILETGTLAAPDRIAAAARAGVMAGVDFLKTSTGKIPAGATPEAAAVLLAVIAEAGGRVGLKVSGGVRTPEDAATYLTLADAFMGAGWPGPTRFRIGASALLGPLLTLADLTGPGPGSPA